MITIGKKSYITDVIEKAGHVSLTSEINHSYPTINLEYAIYAQPDVILVCSSANERDLKKIFPNSKIIYLDKKSEDIINRAGPRVYEAIKIFSNI